MSSRSSKSKPRNLIVISDTHFGCRLGLLSPEPIRLDDGGAYHASPAQLKMWALWRAFWDEWVPEVTRGEPYDLVHNGDAIDGVHHNATTPISHNIEDQLAIALPILDEVVQRCKRSGGTYYHVRGTQAHVGQSGVWEEQLAKRLGAKPNDPFYKVARLMLRAIYNPAYPYNCVMIKHAPYIATEKSVKAHETRPDGRALCEDGYQANLRYGSQQSLTRNWHMPMHQTDTLFHKAKVFMGFIFGGEADNHAVNTVPKETLVRITKAEDGGMGGHGVWSVATTGFTPDNESGFMKRYLAGELVKVRKG